MPTVERYFDGFLIEGRNYGPNGLLVQTDYDFPSIARDLGWNLTRVQRDKQGKVRHLLRASRRGCQHIGTDGTVDCRDCGVTASAFIEAAADFLDSY